MTAPMMKGVRMVIRPLKNPRMALMLYMRKNSSKLAPMTRNAVSPAAI